ncbi:Uncharacterised protein [Halioglobus japonicus]|nr:Uncharacterised protein [Halioglobus japonicus]
MFLSGCDWIGLASVSSAGVLSNGDSESMSLSGDGRYVAFDSTASNLVPGDTNASVDIFVRDLLEGVTTRVSLTSAGGQANSHSSNPAISADGRFVAFQSKATNLVANITNNDTDIFVHDRITGTTTRVSVDSAGNEGNSYSFLPSISTNGRYVAFESEASNLVAGDTNNRRDVFVHDRSTGITTRVSVGIPNIYSVSGGNNSQISANGRYVVFGQSGTGVFVHDRNSGTTTRASVDSAGNPSGGWRPSISADGRYVAFQSSAGDLVPGDTNSYTDVFLHDRSTGKTTRASVSSTGAQSNENSEWSAISGDGRYVVFGSWASNLVANDTNGDFDIFVHDRTTATTLRSSLGAYGAQADRSSDEVAVSGDGRYVAFASWASNLAAGDDNEDRDVFVRAIPHLTVSSVVPKMLPLGSTTQIVVHGSDFLPGTRLQVEDAELSNLVVWSESLISANVTVKNRHSAGARDIKVYLPGAGAGPATGSLGVCVSCVTFF